MSNRTDTRDERLNNRPPRDEASFARAPVPIFILDANAVVTEVSDRCLDLLGYCRAEVVGRKVYDFEDSLSPHLTSTAWDGFLARGEIRDEEWTLVRRDGSKLDVLVSATVEHLSSGSEVRVIAALVDVTGRKSADAALKVSEAGLRQAEKMEAVGQLTGGITHDFNNVLQTIKSNLIRSRSVDDRPDIWRLADKALSAADKATKLSSQLLAFARSEPLDLRPLDPTAIVDGIRELLARAAGDRVTLHVVYREQAVPACLADQNQLECALLNLVINSRDALGRAVGTITISLDVEHVEEAAGVGPANGDYLRIAVRDDGPGMPEEVRRRAFEPFFTTKEAGKGSGLGLAQIHRFVHQCGGAVLIESAPGQGTEVAMLLPSTDQPLRRSFEPPLSAVEVQGGVGETVLIVEDDEMVRATLAETLGDLQYEVVEAVDADAALALLESGKAVDLVVTDLSMPGSMDGLDFAWATRRRFSRLPVILATGQVGALSGKALPAGAAFMQKPFSRTELAAALRSALVGA
jgi:PAS domain S-box-containing protein